MGILDEAIRDHLELKRRGGAAEGDLRRLEDEAFGPPRRPDEPQIGSPAAASEVSTSSAVAEPPPAERPEAAAAAGGPRREPEGVFHDFAAEEGLVSDAAPPTPAEKDFDFEAAEVELDKPKQTPETRAGEPESAQAEPEAPTSPYDALRLDDTQPHDMDAELGTAEPPPAEGLEIDDDLELELDEVELETPNEVVEEVEVVEERGDEGSAQASDDSGEAEDSGDDVLEETPDFLRETPEHDRLWFEQKPPKDFDFDE
jgi:hypothetical protein